MRSRSSERLTDSELAAWRGLLRITVRLRRELGRRLVERDGLTMAEYDALVQLADQPEHRMRMADLAEAILQPRSSLTRIADGLEARDLIRRRPSADDARGAEAVLTEQGLATFRAAQRGHHDSVRELFLDRLSDAHLRALADAWSAVDPDALTPAADERHR